jgi:hypothetical protein
MLRDKNVFCQESQGYNLRKIQLWKNLWRDAT